MTNARATRGVFRLPWIGPSGQSYYVAVDRHGRRILKAAVLREQDSAEMVDALWEMLDQRDPPHRLRLVS
jgi:hypothetical protein